MGPECTFSPMVRVLHLLFGLIWCSLLYVEEIGEIFKDFVVELNGVDRRLIVNRSKKLKMYRVWLQGKFRKPLDAKEELD